MDNTTYIVACFSCKHFLLSLTNLWYILKNYGHAVIRSGFASLSLSLLFYLSRQCPPPSRDAVKQFYHVRAAHNASHSFQQNNSEIQSLPSLSWRLPPGREPVIRDVRCFFPLCFLNNRFSSGQNLNSEFLTFTTSLLVPLDLLELPRDEPRNML